MKLIETKIGDRGAYMVGYVQEPSREMSTVQVRPAVLVLPGGAYLFTSDREAEPVALAYAAEGFQTFVLRYSTGKRAVGCQPLKEASEAIGYLRDHAEELHLDPNKIAVCGFSAGGHLAAWVGLQGENRPNAMILCYGASSIGKKGMENSPLVKSLLGDENTPENVDKLNLEQFVDENAPALFSWGTAEDVLVKARSLLALADAYAAAERPFELHIYQRGEHGTVLAKPITAYGRQAMVDPVIATWHPLSTEWLWRHFGKPDVADRPYVPIPGLIPDFD